MTEQKARTDPLDAQKAASHVERRAAHERLSTGALARWARLCATHPWRVVTGWIGIVTLSVPGLGRVPLIAGRPLSAGCSLVLG